MRSCPDTDIDSVLLTSTIRGDRYFQQINHHFEIGWPIMSSTSRENLSAPEKK